MLTQLSVRDYVARLASDDPTPGGGSAAALLGALAAALGEMVANFTRDREGWTEVAPALAKLTTHRDALLDLTDRDAEAYAAVGAAYKLPKSTEAEKSARLEAIQVALKASAQVPLAVIRELSAAVTVLPVLLESGNRNLVSDVGVAADFAQSALRCAWLNVEINLNGIKDEEHNISIRQSMEEMISKAENVAADVWDQTVDLITQEE
ncbi:MAG: cyclodeaminase/cyclohydrolase family protein [Armatimonadota bacterium]